MLVYAFDLLYAIYEEQGYEPSEIPEKILTHNLYGIEIDERAGELAAFALTMKAREKSRRFLRKPVQPKICVLKPIEFTDDELTDYIDFVGQNLFTVPLLETLNQFKEADNFGSLIRPVVTDVKNMVKLLEDKDVGGQLLLYQTHQKVLQVLKQADYLSPKYHVVVANPPYMGSKGMNGQLSAWVKENYLDSKSNLFAAFIERNLKLSQKRGMVAMITMESWMFLSSFENLRNRILEQNTILSMAHLGARAFDSIGGEVVSTTAFVLENSNNISYKGSYLRLVDGNSEAEKKTAILEAIKDQDCGLFFYASATNFKKIPGSPIAYWVSESVRHCFTDKKYLAEYSFSDGKNITGNNDKFQRYYWEISANSVGGDSRWVFISKGGGFKKWFDVKDITIDWSENSRIHYRRSSVGRVISEHLWFKRGISWGLITSSIPSFRLLDKDFTFSDVGLFFGNDNHIFTTIAFLNSKVSHFFLNLLNPTLNYPMEVVLKLPISNILESSISQKLLEDIKNIKDFFSIIFSQTENSWDFTHNSLLILEGCHTKLKNIYTELRNQWQEMTLKMQHLEEENNRIFIEAYGLQDELTPDVPLHEITLTCNPHYRYDHTKPEAELEALLLADTMKEYISYAVGCMFGRYSLDKPGLILANQGETIEDYSQQVPEPTFSPDKDNVIPILDGDWFADDICDRFRQFLRVTFSEDHYEENLKFIEKAIAKDIRKYFLKDFFNDHVKRYKKRPIYWLFSSPKGSFNALIYLHRYRPDTVSVVLNDYLREFLLKLNARLENLRQIEVSADISQSEKTKAIKEITKLTKTIEELKDYERDVLYPLAIQQVQLDLDDGVKVNYPKLGTALKKITGL
jgi:type II restriction/modification system DNA methylase subunit YeeA